MTTEAMTEFTEEITALHRIHEFPVPGKLHWHVSVRGVASPRFDEMGDAERAAQQLSDEYPEERVWVRRCRGGCR